MSPSALLTGLWIAFVVSWIAAALWAKQAVARMPIGAQLPLYGGALIVGLAPIIAARMFPGLRVRLWAENALLDWGMVAVSILAFAWCWWARIHLGSLWSVGINRREGHRIVDTGPYGVVRHPIYMGLILAMFAFALVRGRPATLLIALSVAIFFSFKARLEERFLRQELGAAYDTYSQRVARLVPFLRL